MNNLRTNTSGIDIHLENLQTKLYNAFVKVNSSLNLNGFGRVYINPSETGFRLEWYKGDDEYEDVLRCDDSRFFFVMNPQLETEDSISAKVGIVFMIDLNDLYQNTERNDEKLRQLAYNTILKSAFKPKKITIGTDYLNRFALGFTGSPRRRNIDAVLDFEDMNPYHIFTIETEVDYTFKNCN